MKTVRKPVRTSVNKGFTLTELLVVVVTVSFLVGSFMPVLQKISKKAKQNRCSFNLRQYGTAIHSFSADNDGGIMSTPLFDGTATGMPFPDHWFAKIPIGIRSDNFSCEAITRYIDVFSWGPPDWWDSADQSDVRDHMYATKLATCPSIKKKYIESLVNNYWQACLGRYGPDMGDGYIQNGYAYYGRVDRWERGAMNKAKEELTANSLTADRIIMADTIRWSTAPSYKSHPWSYNHGKYGWVSNFNPKGYADVGEPELSGINQMYGDGHVEWKDASEMNTPKMGTRRFKGGYVDVWGGGMALCWYYASPSAFYDPPRNRFGKDDPNF